jgi:hypothetical protein
LRQFQSANFINASYLFYKDISEVAYQVTVTNDINNLYNLAELTPQYSYKGDALKLAFGWVYYGYISYK